MLEIIIFGLLAWMFIGFVNFMGNLIKAAVDPRIPKRRQNWQRVPLWYREEMAAKGYNDLEYIRKGWKLDPRNANF